MGGVFHQPTLQRCLTARGGSSLATQPKQEGATRDALAAAVQAQIESVKTRLGGLDPSDDELHNAVSFGAALHDATDCKAMDDAAARLARVPIIAGEMTGKDASKLYDDKVRVAALQYGLLTGKRESLSPPHAVFSPAAGKHAKKSKGKKR